MEKNNSSEIYKNLDTLNIPYTRLSHSPVATMADCREIGKKLGAPFCKNLFLSNRQGTKFYLLMIQEEKQFKTAVISKLLGVSRLSFGDEAKLYHLLGVMPGAITPLGLLHDGDKQVELIIDSDLPALERICVHVCVNNESVSLAMADLNNKFFPYTGHLPKYIGIQEEPPLKLP